MGRYQYSARPCVDLNQLHSQSSWFSGVSVGSRTIAIARAVPTGDSLLLLRQRKLPSCRLIFSEHCRWANVPNGKSPSRSNTKQMLQGDSPTYTLNEETHPVIRAIGVSHTACEDEFQPSLPSHGSWSIFVSFIIYIYKKLRTPGTRTYGVSDISLLSFFNR